MHYIKYYMTNLHFYLNNTLLKPEFSFVLPKNKMIKLSSINWTLSNNKINVNILIDKYNKQLLLEGESFTDIHPELKFRINFHKRHLPILKSQLQKCTRRSKIEIGIKTAISMVLIEDKNDNIRQIGLFELLRRLTIIIIEDAVLSEVYTFLMWCMAVLSKGYTLNGYCIEKIIEAVKGILSSGFKDPNAYNSSKKVNRIDIMKLINNNINYPEIISILFRSSYKGMDGDTNMLLISADTWARRYKHKSETIKYIKLSYYLPIEKYEQLQKGEIQAESLDFHCTNIVERIKKYIEMDNKKMENLIWQYESSITDRINIKPEKVKNTEISKDWRSIKLIFQMETKKLTYEL